MSAELESLTWPMARLGDAMEAVASRSPVPAVQSGRGGNPQAVRLPRIPPPLATYAREDGEAIGHWVESTARQLHMEAERLPTRYAELEGVCNEFRCDVPGLLCLEQNGEPRFTASIGLAVPRTLVTNDPDKVGEFYHVVDGLLVAELLTPLSASMGKAPFFMHTSEVGEADLADLASLRYSPMIFQERIPKARELRVIFADGRFFVGAVDASESAAGQTYWRLATPDECPWQRDEISDELAEPFKMLMTELGLVFGTIDLILTPDGRHVFLEVNPAGEWGMLERDLGYPISESIADALVGQRGGKR